MNTSNLLNYVLLASIVLFFVWKKWRDQKLKPLINEYLDKRALIVDVRSPEEYRGGHNETSVNIPLNVLTDRLHELDKSRAIIVCCASGGRSANAFAILKSQGFKDVINAGPWQNAVRK